jgi:hypothetical protein
MVFHTTVSHKDQDYSVGDRKFVASRRVLHFCWQHSEYHNMRQLLLNKFEYVFYLLFGARTAVAVKSYA